MPSLTSPLHFVVPLHFVCGVGVAIDHVSIFSPSLASSTDERGVVAVEEGSVDGIVQSRERSYWKGRIDRCYWRRLVGDRGRVWCTPSSVHADANANADVPENMVVGSVWNAGCRVPVSWCKRVGSGELRSETRGRVRVCYW